MPLRKPDYHLTCSSPNAEFDDACGVAVRTRTQLQAFDFRLQPALAQACSKDIMFTCDHVIEEHAKDVASLTFEQNKLQGTLHSTAKCFL